MGQKVNPYAFRLPLLGMQGWKSRWFTTDSRRYKAYLADDVKLRKALMKRLSSAGITGVEIERSLKSLKVKIFVTRPGVVIGRGGAGIEDLKKFIYKVLGFTEGGKNIPRIDMPVEEVKEPDLSAYLVATRVAEQLVRRIPARRVVTKTLERSMSAGAKGIKIQLSGRVGGAEIGRREKYKAGSIPLSTLRANVDYANVPALTRSGYVGIKTWIYKGEQ